MASMRVPRFEARGTSMIPMSRSARRQTSYPRIEQFSPGTSQPRSRGHACAGSS
jgi:hypothetical protein